MTARLEHYDTDTLADVKAQRDALYGALIRLGVQSDADPAGPHGRFAKAEDRAASEKHWACRWWDLATSDGDEAAELREIAARQTRGGAA